MYPSAVALRSSEVLHGIMDVPPSLRLKRRFNGVMPKTGNDVKILQDGARLRIVSTAMRSEVADRYGM